MRVHPNRQFLVRRTGRAKARKPGTEPTRKREKAKSCKTMSARASVASPCLQRAPKTERILFLGLPMSHHGKQQLIVADPSP